MPVLIAVVTTLALIVILMTVFGRKGSHSRSSHTSHSQNRKSLQKNQAHIIREANKRLAKDPHDPAGLLPLGDIYFNNGLWEKAYPVYNDLSKLSATNTQIDTYTTSLRAGICAVKLEKIQDALMNLTVAYKLNTAEYDVNYYMGLALFKNKSYEKAIPCFKKALVLKPDAEGVYILLGQSFYLSGHIKECLPCFKKALDEDPGNKEALYDMADAMTEQGHGDKAIKVFMHLRPDPVYGARSCLQAGTYHSKINQIENAIQDFEIGLKHENVPVQTKLDIMYRLARSYFAVNQIQKGLILAKRIRDASPNYKDVGNLINRYQELSQNSNLQIYLTAGSNDFVSLCRKIVNSMFKGATVKIQDISVGPVFTDILANIETPKWENTECFRFFRTTGTTGEFYVRDFHGHMHDIKADHGYCISAGNYTEEAHKFIEGRPLDLIEKVQLTKIIKTIN